MSTKKIPQQFKYIKSKSGNEKILVKILNLTDLEGPQEQLNSEYLIILHDYFDYHKYYIDFATELIKQNNNLKVLLFDFKGLGRSSGDRGYIKKWNEYPLDVQNVIESFLPLGQQFHLLGAGLGGNVALDLMFQKEFLLEERIKSLILINPLLKLKVDYPKWTKKIVRNFPSLLERARFPIRFNYHRFCTDYQHAQKVNADALIPHDISFRSVVELLETNNRLKSLSYFIKKPTFILLSEKGHICNNEYIKVYAKGIEKKYLQIIEYSNAYHDLIHDKKAGFVKEDILKWLKKYSSASSV